MTGGQGKPLTPLEQRLFGADTSPADRGLDGLARPFVDRAKLTYKLFRRDLEKIEDAVARAYKDGQLSQRQATDIYLDIGYVLSLPLIQRYLAARECEKVADWLRSRDRFHLTGWLDQRNSLAIDGFIANGETALAVALLRQHLHRMMIGTRADWRFAAQTLKRRAEGDAIDPASDGLAELSGKLELAMLEIAEADVYLKRHGSKSDHDAVAAYRDEIAKVRTRFNIST